MNRRNKVDSKRKNREGGRGEKVDGERERNGALSPAKPLCLSSTS